MKNISKQAKVLLIVSILYLAAIIIASTFVNVYLYGLSMDYSVIIIINVINYAVVVGSFVIGAKLVSKVSILNLMRLGIISTGIYFLLILLLQEQASQLYFMIPLGIFNGIGMGFYYFSLNNLISKLTNDDNRGNFFGLQSSLSTIFSVAIPPISGLLIKTFDKSMGYYILFGISCIIFAISFIYSMLLVKIDFNQKYNVLGVLKLKNNPDWSVIKLRCFSMSLRYAIFDALFVVFATSIIVDESMVGTLSSIMSVIGIIVAGYVGRTLKNKNMREYHLLFAFLFLIALYIGGIFASTWSVVIMYIILGIGNTGYMIVSNNFDYKMFDRAQKSGFQTADFIVATEFPIAFGRIVGLLLYYGATFVIDASILPRIVFILIPLLTLMEHLFVEKKLHWFKNEQDNDDTRPVQGIDIVETDIQEAKYLG